MSIDFSAMHDTEAEKMILACVLFRPACIFELEALRPEAFYSQHNRLIFENMQEMAGSNKGIDIATLASHMQDNGSLAKVGGLSAITMLGLMTPTAAYLSQYVDIVQAMHKRREMALLGQELVTMAGNGDMDTSALQGKLARLEAGSSGEILPMKETCLRLAEWIDERAKNEFTGIMTGIAPVDVALHGWQKKNLVILAARPAMGKTSMAQTFALSAAKKGKTVLFFSLEMGIEELGARMNCMISKVPLEKLLNPRMMDSGEWDRMMKAQNDLAKLNLFIDEKSGLTPTQIMARARQIQGQYGLDLIIVDYLQIINGGGRENRVQEISYISSSLKAMAKDLNVPVIALSQLSRLVEQRADKRPMMSDLRDGGTIEQDADIIITLYRDKYYNPESRDDITEFDIKKFRNGKTKCVNLKFVPDEMRFESAMSFGGAYVKEVPW